MSSNTSLLNDPQGIKRFYLVDFFEDARNYFIYDEKELKKLRKMLPAPFGEVTEIQMKRYTNNELLDIPKYGNWTKVRLYKNGFLKEGFVSLLDDIIRLPENMRTEFRYEELEEFEEQLKTLKESFGKKRYEMLRNVGKPELLANRLDIVKNKFDEIDGGNKELIIFRSNYVAKYPFHLHDFWDGVFFFSIGTYYRHRKSNRNEMLFSRNL